MPDNLAEKDDARKTGATTGRDGSEGTTTGENDDRVEYCVVGRGGGSEEDRERQVLVRKEKVFTDAWVAFKATTLAARETGQDEQDENGAIAAGVH